MAGSVRSPSAAVWCLWNSADCAGAGDRRRRLVLSPQVPKVFLMHGSVGFEPDLHETVYPLVTEMLYAMAARVPRAGRLPGISGCLAWCSPPM